MPFWELMVAMGQLGRHPKLIALENVVGALTSHNGKDFSFIIDSMVKEGYRVGALVMDAVRFLPQSRPRLFIVGVHEHIAVPSQLALAEGAEPCRPKSRLSAFAR